MLVSTSGAIVPTSSSLADRTPVIVGSNYYNTSALALTGYWADFAWIYRRQLWVRTVIKKLAYGHARLPFGIRIADDKGGLTPEHGPLEELLQRPNPRMAGFHFWRWISSTRDIYGEAFVVKIRDQKGRVRELWPLHPTNVIVRMNKDAKLEYVYAAGHLGAVEGLPVFAEEDVIVFTEYNPENSMRGLSALESLRDTLLNEDAARRATAAFWRNGARPGVLLEHPKTLGGGALERLQQQFDAGTAGPDGVGKTKILEEGMKATIVQLNLEEMQYIDSRKLNREEVCAVYDVAPPAVHILDKATFSNITEQLRGFYRDTMAPRNEDFESVIDLHLVPDFYPDGSASSWFNMDEVLRGDFETRAAAVGTLIEKGVYKPSEARPLFNLQPAGPEADALYGNAALVPLGSNAHPQQVATDGTLIPQPMPQPKALTTRSVMGRLSRSKAGGTTALKTKLVEEHAKELRSFTARQKESVLAAARQKDAGLFTPTDWDAELAGIIHTLSQASTKAVGAATAKTLGGAFDETPISDWLREDATTSAVNLNATTAAMIAARKQLVDEDPDLDLDSELADFFDTEMDDRVNEISLSRVVMLAGFAALVAADQSGAKTKTWNVTSSNPRASHASMNGETVGIGETFSNGMDGPGDFTGGADEVAGCTCELSFNL